MFVNKFSLKMIVLLAMNNYCIVYMCDVKYASVVFLTSNNDVMTVH